MKALFKKLYDYLSDEYSPEEIYKSINDVKIRKIRSDYVEIVWSNGVLERLELGGDGKLKRINDKLEKAAY